MEQLLQKVKKELAEISEQELTMSNVDLAGKLIDIVKDIGEIEEQKEKTRYKEEGYGMRYMERGYYDEPYYGYMRPRGMRGRYAEGRPDSRGYHEYQGNRGEYGHGNWGMWGQADYDKLSECLDRIADGKDMYEHDKSRYRGDDERVLEALEKMMYGVCMFAETAMEIAETAEEKEVIRKHLRKLERI